MRTTLPIRGWAKFFDLRPPIELDHVWRARVRWLVPRALPWRLQEPWSLFVHIASVCDHAASLGVGPGPMNMQ